MTDTDTTTLLPCPFCGGEAEIIHGVAGRSYVRCTKCAACGNDKRADRAIAAWNRRRPTPPATDDEREGLAMAVSTRTFAFFDGDEDCGDWPEMSERARNIYREAADAALAYLAPIRAREIAAAEARGVEMERARVVAWLRRPFWGDDTSVIIGQAHIAAACDIERGEHNTGKEG